MNLASLGLRVAAVGVGLFLWFWTQKLIARKAPASSGVYDLLHAWSAPWHHWLLGHPQAANGVLIATSALIDCFGLYLLGSAVFGPTFRPFIAILILFGLRQICQAIGTLPIPKDMIWRHPGFPSLLVTYSTGNDFFFSGHTAIAVLGAIELAHAAPPWLAIAAGIVATVEAATVIVLRAHYTMDVFAAIFTAWGAQRIAQIAAPGIDAWLSGLM